MPYRPDLDGLRAVAVLAVLGYHALIPGFQRGYLGVDVFFTLSGYLIAGVIFQQIDEGRFSLPDFYLRRIRRLLPALLAMLGTVALAGLWLMYPPEYQDLGTSLIAASLQAANLYFMVVTDYFAEGNSAKPLLHTWSLGVEEQFYLIFPLLCLILPRKWRRMILVALALTFFGLSLMHAQAGSAWAFFSPLSRAWELLAGAALVGLRAPAPRGGGVLGIAALLYALMLYSPLSRDPAPSALLPVGATLMVIWAGQSRSVSGSILSFKPLVWMGLLSYSLYLWHWPILTLAQRPLIDTLARYGALEGLSGGVIRLGLLGLSLLTAYLSWRWIERPFRHEMTPKIALRSIALGVFMTASLGAIILAFQGFPQRFPPETTRLAAFIRHPHPEYREHQCFLTSRSKLSDFDPSACLSGQQVWLLLGDSHAAHLAHGLRASLGEGLLQANASGCKPFLRPLPASPSPCQSLMAQMLTQVAQPSRIKGVILAARWAEADLQPLRDTAIALQSRGLQVRIIGVQPQYHYELPLILARGHDPRGHELPHLRERDRRFQTALTAEGLSYTSAYQAICTPDCPRTINGVPLYYDYSHLTAGGSVLMASALIAAGLLRGRTND